MGASNRQSPGLGSSDVQSVTCAGYHDKVKNRITTRAELKRWRLEYGTCRYNGSTLEKRCPCCHGFFPMTTVHFGTNLRHLDGLDYECRDCHSGAGKRYLARDRREDGRFAARV